MKVYNNNIAQLKKSELDQILIYNTCQLIKSVYPNIQSIYLVGSFANRKQASHSDIDLLVVSDDALPQFLNFIMSLAHITVKVFDIKNITIESIKKGMFDPCFLDARKLLIGQDVFKEINYFDKIYYVRYNKEKVEKMLEQKNLKAWPVRKYNSLALRIMRFLLSSKNIYTASKFDTYQNFLICFYDYKKILKSFPDPMDSHRIISPKKILKLINEYHAVTYQK